MTLSQFWCSYSTPTRFDDKPELIFLISREKKTKTRGFPSPEESDVAFKKKYFVAEKKKTIPSRYFYVTKYK